jgi:hypothetical protein
MTPEYSADSQREEHWEAALAERMENIHILVRARDTKQTEFLGLLSRTTPEGHVPTDAWDAWLELQIAQNDLDLLMKAEMRNRIAR